MWNKKLMSNKKDMSQLDATLTRVPLTLTFDLEFSRKVKLYLGNVKPDCHGTKGTGVDRMAWRETLRKWVNWMLSQLGYLWPWIFKVKSYLGNGRPDGHGTKGTGVDRMPRCEILREWVSWTLRWLGYLWLWPWIFKVILYLGNGRRNCYETKGTGVDMMPWYETQALCDLEAEDTVRDQGDLRCRRFRRFV